MTKHLLLSTDYPHKWKIIIKILNAHQPDKVTFCHFSEEPLEDEFLLAPAEFNDWMKGMWDIEFNQINMYFDEKPNFGDDDKIILDIRAGATFSQIMIMKLLPSMAEVWCTSYGGEKCTRIDKVGSFDAIPFNPLKILELSGLKSSMQLVEVNNFDMSYLNQFLMFVGSNVRLNHEKLRKAGIYDPDWMTVTLTDDDGEILIIDSREKDGFWLEDIVMQCLARFAAKVGKSVYRNIVINREDELEQLRRALENLAKGKVVRPIVNAKIKDYFKISDLSLLGDALVAIELDLPDFKRFAGEKIFQAVFSTGAKNEFDGMLVDDTELIIIEMKTAKPKDSDFSKLMTLYPRHLSPMKRQVWLIHSFHTILRNERKNYDEFVEKYRSLFPNITQWPWINLTLGKLKVPELWNTNNESVIHQIKSRLNWNDDFWEEHGFDVAFKNGKWSFYCPKKHEAFLQNTVVKKMKRIKPFCQDTFRLVITDEEE